MSHASSLITSYVIITLILALGACYVFFIIYLCVRRHTVAPLHLVQEQAPDDSTIDEEVDETEALRVSK